MRLYLVRTPDSDPSAEQQLWAGTQADARRLSRNGVGAWEQVDVPTDKDGLLAFLNAPSAAGAAPPEQEAPQGAPEPAEDGKCPKCARTPRAAELLALGDDKDAIAAWIFEQPAWSIEFLLGAIGARVGQLRG